MANNKQPLKAIKGVKGIANVSGKKITNNLFSRRASMSTGSLLQDSSVSRLPLMYVDPMLDPILLMFPKENIKELNRRLRHYYTFHPLVHSIIDLHASYALSDFELRCDDKEIELYYNDVKERLDLLTMMINLNRDFWLLGNAYMYGDWDDVACEWTAFNQFPAENIDIHRAYLGGTPVYFLKADESIKQVLQSNKAADVAVAETIPAEFKAALLTNTPYQLANERLIHFANRPAQYALLGESILKSCLKDLMYEDKLRLLQFTYADRATYPIKHWKVGSEAGKWVPDQAHIDKIKELIMAGGNDPDYNIITHPFVSLDIHDQKGMWADLKAEFDFSQKRIMMGLFCNDAMIGGEASPYAKDVINMKVVMHRYIMNRNLLERVIREKIYLPIAREHKIVKRTSAELKYNLRLSSSTNNYILPKFFYKERVNLLSTQAEQELILRLREKGEIPFEIVADLFGWDTAMLKKKFVAETGTVFDTDYKSAKKELIKDASNRARLLNGEFNNNNFESLKNKQTKTPEGVAGAVLGGGEGRPKLPIDELVQPETAVLPNSTGELSPRSKNQAAGAEIAPSIPKELEGLV